MPGRNMPSSENGPGPSTTTHASNATEYGASCPCPGICKTSNCTSSARAARRVNSPTASNTGQIVCTKMPKLVAASPSSDDTEGER